MRVTSVAGAIRPVLPGIEGIRQLRRDVEQVCGRNGMPLRIAVTETSESAWACEIDAVDGAHEALPPIPSIFEFRRRPYERTHAFNAVMLVPTGIDCAIGGHAGDATPAARLLASVCDRLIVHPNIVNASDVNEQTDNCLYVEGSLICRLLMGTISLRLVRSNRIIVVTERRDDGPWATDQTVNSVSAARATLGVDCVKVVVLERGPAMAMERADSGRAVGKLAGLDRLLSVLRAERAHYDAIALSTRVTPAGDTNELYGAYFGGEGPNPWGGVEASLTHAVSAIVGVQSAHAPTIEDLALRTLSYGRVDPRKAAEAISTSYMFCLLKGLHRAPAVVTDPSPAYDPSIIGAEDVACLVIPAGVVGLPVIAAATQGIPVIAVADNRNLMHNDLGRLPFARGQLHVVASYLEAAGLIAALKSGINPASVRRPLAPTVVSAY